MIPPFVPAETFPDLEDIGIRLTLNGKVVQDGNSNMMLNPIVPMIQHMAANFSLQAGDLIMTGTPAGVGPLKPATRSRWNWSGRRLSRASSGKPTVFQAAPKATRDHSRVAFVCGVTDSPVGFAFFHTCSG